MSETREQQPPMTTAELQRTKRDPDRQYRYVGIDKETIDSDKVGDLVDIGYRVEGKSKKMTLLSCPKDEHEKRQAAARARAEKSRKAAAKMEGGEGFKPERDDLGQERMASPQ